MNLIMNTWRSQREEGILFQNTKKKKLHIEGLVNMQTAWKIIETADIFYYSNSNYFHRSYFKLMNFLNY